MPFAGLFSTDVNTLGDINVWAQKMCNLYAQYLTVKESERNLKIFGMTILPKRGTWACLHSDREFLVACQSTHCRVCQDFTGKCNSFAERDNTSGPQEPQIYLLPEFRFQSVTWAQLAQLDLPFLSEILFVKSQVEAEEFQPLHTHLEVTKNPQVISSLTVPCF